MKNLQIVILFFLIAFSACKDKHEKEVVVSYPDGSPMRIVEFDYQGDTKKILFESRFFPNGQVEMEGGIENEQRNGLWTYYTENGQKWMEETYKNGVLNGPFKVWYLSGELKYTGEYYESLPDKMWEFFDESGEKSNSILYERGVKKQ